MGGFWVDDAARRLAEARSRRGLFRALLGLVLFRSTVGRGRVAGAEAQLECSSGWETYCTDLLDAEECIDFSSDSANCGFCRNACPGNTHCADFLCTGTVDGQPPAGLLSASVQCVDGPQEWPRDELLDVIVTNNSGQAVIVAHISSLLGPAQPSYPGFEVGAGEAWQGLVPRTFPDGIATQGAVITTDTGTLVLPCGYTDIPFSTRPVSLDDPNETAAIMARTLSVLESTGTAFDALHTLLHPDARELVSYNQLTCWYLNYVRTEHPAGEATVTAVRIAPWTWGGNGVRYEDAAEVTYRQPFYVPKEGEELRETEEREATIHLVQHNGIWRWFFGTDPEWLAALPETC
jgi:hypothetical protein